MLIILLLLFLAQLPIQAQNANQNTMSGVTLKAYFVDENNQAWDENVELELYRNAIHPDSIIKTGNLDSEGYLLMTDIATAIKDIKLGETETKLFPVHLINFLIFLPLFGGQ